MLVSALVSSDRQRFLIESLLDLSTCFPSQSQENQGPGDKVPKDLVRCSGTSEPETSANDAHLETSV